ncbi:hypothetical protein HDU86_002127 [Geranomyces michiganensis]|nr:hypothetical protein HDU86_002127 [Geranomyces michiganensis]
MEDSPKQEDARPPDDAGPPDVEAEALASHPVYSAPLTPSNHAAHLPNTGHNTTHGSVTSAKRAEQNRAAQRAFRERKQRYIKELEVKAALLDARNGQLGDSEVRHRDLRTMVERLTRERDVRIKERELWWREREEVFRIVDALRKDLEQLHGENERLKEVVFGLWQESRENGSANEDMDVDGDSGNMLDDAIRKEALDDTTTADTEGQSGTIDTEGTGASKSRRDGPSLGSIPFDTLIEKGPNGTGAPSTPSNANSLSDALLVDLKNRITYWDSERESLYRTASFPPIPISSQDATVSPTQANATRQTDSITPADTADAPIQDSSSNGVVPSPQHQVSGQTAAQNTFMDTLFSTILQQTSGPFSGGPNGGFAAGPSTARLLPSTISILVNNPDALQATMAASKSSSQNGNTAPGDGHPSFSPNGDPSFLMNFAAGAPSSDGKPS